MNNENLRLFVACILVFMCLYLFTNKNTVEDFDKQTAIVLISKQAGIAYMNDVSKAFSDVGQDCIDGKYKTFLEVHSELQERNEQALERYNVINEALDKVNQNDIETLGKMCVGIGKGLKQSVKQK